MGSSMQVLFFSSSVRVWTFNEILKLPGGSLCFCLRLWNQDKIREPNNYRHDIQTPSYVTATAFSKWNPTYGLLLTQPLLHFFNMLPCFFGRIRDNPLKYSSAWRPLARLRWAFQHATMASTFPNLPVFRAIASHDPKSTAVIHSKSNRSFTYGELLKDVEAAKIDLYHQLKRTMKDDETIGGQRVAFLVENSYDYVGATVIRPYISWSTS